MTMMSCNGENPGTDDREDVVPSKELANKLVELRTTEVGDASNGVGVLIPTRCIFCYLSTAGTRAPFHSSIPPIPSLFSTFRVPLVVEIR